MDWPRGCPPPWRSTLDHLSEAGQSRKSFPGNSSRGRAPPRPCLLLLPATGLKPVGDGGGSRGPRCSFWAPVLWPLWKDEMAGDTSGLRPAFVFLFSLRSVQSPRSRVQRRRLQNGEIRFCFIYKAASSIFLSLGCFPPNLHEPPLFTHSHVA